MKYDIAIIDSGLGGLSVFKNIKNRLSFKRYIYFADLKNLPYGNKSLKKLIEITTKNINFLIKKYKVKNIIFGCNTISLNVYTYIKDKFKDLKIYAIKPNFKVYLNEYNNILFLGTKKSVSKLKYNKTYLKNKDSIKLIGLKNLASKVEEYIENGIDIVPYIKNIFKNTNKNFDCVILGCTHYIFIKDKLKNIFRVANFKDNIDFLIEDIQNDLKCNKVVSNFKVKFIFTKNKKKKRIYKRLLKDNFL